MPKPKRHALFPLAYDEISLVDDGAAGSADVLIMKRNGAVTKARPRAGRVVAGSGAREPGRPPVKDKNKGKGGKKGGGRSQENPCSTASNKTGKKDGKSTRSKNWKEEKHKRKEGGKFAETSSESKAKNGKGGTTKAKLDAACRKKKGGKGGNAEGRPVTGSKRPRRKPKIEKSSIARWDSDAHLRALMERK